MATLIETIDGSQSKQVILNNVTKTIIPSVAAGNSVLLSAPNPARRGFIIWNNSSNSTYISLDTVSVASTCAWIIATFQSKDFVNFAYTGAISAIRNSGTGTWTIYEFFA